MSNTSPVGLAGAGRHLPHRREVLLGTIWAAATMVTVIPASLSARIAVTLKVPPEVATLFTVVAMFGELIGFVFVVPHADRRDRVRWLVSRGLAAALVLMTLPLAARLVHGHALAGVQLAILLAANVLTPFEPVARSYVDGHTARPDRARAQNDMTSVFMLGLCVFRVPLVFAAEVLGSPWWGMAASGVLLALAVVPGWMFLEADEGISPPNASSSLRDLWRAARVPTVAWCTALGFGSGFLQGPDGWNAFAFTVHRDAGVIPFLGITGLLGALAVYLLQRWVKDARTRAVWAIVTPAVAYVLMLATVDLRGWAWLTWFLITLTMVYIGVAWGHAAFAGPLGGITVDLTVWVIARVLGIALGDEVGSSLYGRFGIAGPIWGGLIASGVQILILPVALNRIHGPRRAASQRHVPVGPVLVAPAGRNLAPNGEWSLLRRVRRDAWPVTDEGRTALFAVIGLRVLDELAWARAGRLLVPARILAVDRQQLEKRGMRFGAVDPLDALLRDATVPDTWQQVLNEPARRLELVDPDRIVQAVMLYTGCYGRQERWAVMGLAVYSHDPDIGAVTEPDVDLSRAVEIDALRRVGTTPHTGAEIDQVFNAVGLEFLARVSRDQEWLIPTNPAALEELGTRGARRGATLTGDALFTWVHPPAGWTRELNRAASTVEIFDADHVLQAVMVYATTATGRWAATIPIMPEG